MSDPDSIPIAAAVLDYATYDADGLPPWVAEAEAAIDARQKPKTIRKYFRKAEEAVKYFAKSMRRRFSIANAGQACAACGQSPCNTVAMVKWNVSMPLKMLQFKLSNKPPNANFITYHPICVDCMTRWNRAISRIRWTSMAISGLQWALVALFVFGRHAIPFARSSRWEMGLFPVYMLVITIGSLFLKAWAQRRTPRGIAQSMPPRLGMVAIEGFDERERFMENIAAVPLGAKANVVQADQN